MTSIVSSTHSRSNQLLQLSTRAWFAVVVIGQLIFAYYIIMLYGTAGVQGNFERWNAQTTHGYVARDLMGNAFFGLHVFFAAVISILGPLQLISKVRKLFPAFHRFSGRVYLGSAFLISLAGFYLAWVRGTAGGMIGSVFITINGLIILVCVVYTLRFAMKRQIDRHNKWAIRLFLAMSGVWFFRVFLMLWFAIHQAPVGFDMETFQGPFLNFLYVFVYILPQVIAEFYFIAKASSFAKPKIAMSVLLGVLTLGIMVGIATATMGMWLPAL
mgnify:CR=1 FL=1